MRAMVTIKGGSGEIQEVYLLTYIGPNSAGSNMVVTLHLTDSYPWVPPGPRPDQGQCYSPKQ